MAIRTMNLDYGWLINLADIISRARQQPTGKAPTSAYAGPTSTLGEGKTRYQLEQEQRREDVLTTKEREHEVALKQMDIDSKLAEAMSKERIATMGAEAGTEQAEIGAAGMVGAAQKTTMEKGYEFVDMLMKADEKTASAIIASLEAKRAETAGEGGVRPVSTISSGGEVITLPGTKEGVAGDPNDPLTWLEEVGAYTPGGEAPRPKATGAAAKPEIDQYLDLIDDMLDKNPQSIIAITTGKGWDELKERMRTIGAEGGFAEDVINSGISMYEALVPEFEEEVEGKGLLSKVWGGVETTAANIAPFIHQALHPEEKGIEEEKLAKQWEEAAGKVGEPSEAVKSFAEFIETIITGPFHPAYKEYKGKRRGVPTKEPEEGGGLGGAIKGALTPFGIGREELPPEAIPGSEAYLGGAGALKEVPLVEKAPGFAKTLEEFIETIITGPFHPAYEKYKGKRKGMKEPKAEEIGEITKENIESQISKWPEEQIEQFKAAAKAEGLTTWEYYKKHEEEFKYE